MSPGHSNVSQRVDFIISPLSIQDRKTSFLENSFSKIWNDFFPKNTTGCLKKLWTFFLLLALLYLCPSCQAHDPEERDCENAPLVWNKQEVVRQFGKFKVALTWFNQMRDYAETYPLLLNQAPAVMDEDYVKTLGQPALTTYQGALNLCLKYALYPVSFSPTYRWLVSQWYKARGLLGLALSMKTSGQTGNIYWTRNGELTHFGVSFTKEKLDTAAEREGVRFVGYRCCDSDVNQETIESLAGSFNNSIPLVCTARDEEYQNWRKVPHRIAQLLTENQDYRKHYSLFREIIGVLNNDSSYTDRPTCTGSEISLLDLQYEPLPSSDMVTNAQSRIRENLKIWTNLEKNFIATLPQLTVAARMVKKGSQPPFRGWSYIYLETFLERVANGHFLELFFLSTASSVTFLFCLLLLACVCCRKTGLQPCCQGLLTCFLVPCQVLRAWRQPDTTRTLLPSNSIAMRPLATGRKKRRAPTPPSPGFFSSLLPSKSTHTSTNVTVRMSPSTTRKLMHATQQDFRPKRTRALEGRFEEL